MLISEIKNFKWNVNYDVIVIGFGGAGATAARFAADHNCKVLLVDSAPAGHEGGNTRYCGQLIAGTKSKKAYEQYYSKLTEPFNLDKNVKDTFVDNVSNIQEYLKKYLNVTPFSFLDHPNRMTVQSVKGDFPDYLSYSGSSEYNMYTVHDGQSIEDGALWKVLRSEVTKRLDKITIWYSSPAIKLLQNEDNRIVGAVIKRNNKKDIYVHARRGIVLSAGGFENDPDRIQDYLGVPRVIPMGSLYNKGDSIRLSIEVGADQWHTSVFNAGGVYHGLTYAVKTGERGALVYTWPQLYTGSIFVVGNDGTRYFPEDAHSKAGYLYMHGFGRHPCLTTQSWIIFDEKQRKELLKIKDDLLQNSLKTAISANNIKDLAIKLKFDVATFVTTFKTYNEMAKLKKDYQFNRRPETMIPMDDSSIYAIKLQPTVLNTQGGPRRNENAEIVRPDNSVIFGLFGAGEAGGITANQYQAGQDVAELLIFGKIAGDNVSKMPVDNISLINMTNDAILQSDEKNINYQLKANQYLGKSSQGMGNELVVRVTIKPNTTDIEDIKVIKQSETKEIGQKVIQPLLKKIIQDNTIDVDAITGASLTTNAVKDAVKDALSKVKTN